MRTRKGRRGKAKQGKGTERSGERGDRRNKKGRRSLVAMTFMVNESEKKDVIQGLRLFADTAPWARTSS